MNQEMDFEDYEKILMQRPGFKEALKEIRSEYESARTKIKLRIKRIKKDKYGRNNL